jgi:hypothetical protein
MRPSSSSTDVLCAASCFQIARTSSLLSVAVFEKDADVKWVVEAGSLALGLSSQWRRLRASAAVRSSNRRIASRTPSATPRSASRAPM